MPLQLYRLTAICAIRTSPQNRYISCKWLKCTSCIMTTCTSRYSRIDRLNYDVTWTRLPVQLYWLMLLSLVLCEYSKFRIESNSYLLFDSIRNWRKYSKFSNTYLTVISQATETRFVCTLPAVAAVLTCHWSQCCAAPACVRAPTPPTPLTTARELLQAPVSTVTDRVITPLGKCRARPVERWTFCQYCYGFNFNTDTCCI